MDRYFILVHTFLASTPHSGYYHCHPPLKWWAAETDIVVPIIYNMCMHVIYVIRSQATSFLIPFLFCYQIIGVVASYLVILTQIPKGQGI